MIQALAKSGMELAAIGDYLARETRLKVGLRAAGKTIPEIDKAIAQGHNIAHLPVEPGNLVI